tara:strand:- start:3 stop:419 length:417 start_codon:yes stop_codon:yes gene_type:complete
MINIARTPGSGLALMAQIRLNKQAKMAARIQAFYRGNRVPRPEHMLLKKFIGSIKRFAAQHPHAAHDCQRLANMLHAVAATVDRRAVIRVLKRNFKYGAATTKGMIEIQNRYNPECNCGICESEKKGMAVAVRCHRKI